MDCSDAKRNLQVRTEVERLRGASDEQLRAWDRERAQRRIAWYGARLRAQEGDPLERAYLVLLEKLGISVDEAPIVRRDEKEIVFHSKNFCPTLEACKILGLDTRRVCRMYNESSPDALVKQVDPRLSFSRSYREIRPHSPYCEERISLG